MPNSIDLLQATVEIHNPSGGFVVDYIGDTGTRKDFDRIRLVVHYVSLVQHLCVNDQPEIRYGLSALFGSFAEMLPELRHDAVRTAAIRLKDSIRRSIADSPRRRWRKSEKYEARLIQDVYPYVVANFSMFAFKPNLANSAAMLFCDTVERLENRRVEILVDCMAKLLDFWFGQGSGGNANFRQKAFVAVEGTFLLSPEVVPQDEVNLQVMQYLRLNEEQAKVAQGVMEAAILRELSKPPSLTR